MAKFCPECGTATKRGFVSGRERDICSNCGFVQYAKAKIGVGVLTLRGESVLLVERNMPPYGLWTLPSGHQEENETLEMTVIREAWEETGMKIAPRGIVFLRNMMEHGAVDIYCVFLCDSDLEEEPVVNDNESTAARFVPLSNLDKLNIEPDSYWFIKTYLNRQPELLVTRENPFDHPSLQIFMVDGTHSA
jgi:ADP-ribose pyrophosphatase YjhB (NUDIX family)